MILLSVMGLGLLVLGAKLPVRGALKLAARLEISPLVIGLTVAIAYLPIFFTDNAISRWEGIVSMAYYAAYTLYLILNPTQHSLLPLFSTAMVAFILPIPVLTLAVIVGREGQASAQHRGGA